MASPRIKPCCVSCNSFRTHREWDNHEVCPMCRTCSRLAPCMQCMSFTSEQWTIIASYVKERYKLQSSVPSLTENVDSSSKDLTDSQPVSRLGASRGKTIAKKVSKSKGKGGRKASGSVAMVNVVLEEEASSSRVTEDPSGSSVVASSVKKFSQTSLPDDSDSSHRRAVNTTNRGFSQTSLPVSINESLRDEELPSLDVAANSGASRLSPNSEGT